MRVFLDLDGVLCDFVGGALLAHGVPWHFIPAPGQWDLASQLGLTPNQFWDPLQGFDFWANLAPTDDCAGILTAVESRFGTDPVYLLTSPAHSSGCYAGKFAWVKRHLPAYLSRLLLVPAVSKPVLAGPGSLLIDDSDANVAAFRQAGGWGILLPRSWNARHAEFGRSLPCLIEDMAQIDRLTSYHNT
jgi:FMN phosphatase YigB (HAD superfamily)